MTFAKRLAMTCMFVACGTALSGCIWVGPGRGYYHPHYYYGP